MELEVVSVAPHGLCLRDRATGEVVTNCALVGANGMGGQGMELRLVYHPTEEAMAAAADMLQDVVIRNESSEGESSITLHRNGSISVQVGGETQITSDIPLQDLRVDSRLGMAVGNPAGVERVVFRDTEEPMQGAQTIPLSAQEIQEGLRGQVFRGPAIEVRFERDSVTGRSVVDRNFSEFSPVPGGFPVSRLALTELLRAASRGVGYIDQPNGHLDMFTIQLRNAVVRCAEENDTSVPRLCEVLGSIIVHFLRNYEAPRAGEPLTAMQEIMVTPAAEPMTHMAFRAGHMMWRLCPQALEYGAMFPADAMTDDDSSNPCLLACRALSAPMAIAFAEGFGSRPRPVGTEEVQAHVNRITDRLHQVLGPNEDHPQITSPVPANSRFNLMLMASNLSSILAPEIAVRTQLRALAQESGITFQQLYQTMLDMLFHHLMFIYGVEAAAVPRMDEIIAIPLAPDFQSAGQIGAAAAAGRIAWRLCPEDLGYAPYSLEDNREEPVNADHPCNQMRRLPVQMAEAFAANFRSMPGAGVTARAVPEGTLASLLSLAATDQAAAQASLRAVAQQHGITPALLYGVLLNNMLNHLSFLCTPQAIAGVHWMDQIIRVRREFVSDLDRTVYLEEASGLAGRLAWRLSLPEFGYGSTGRLSDGALFTDPSHPAQRALATLPNEQGWAFRRAFGPPAQPSPTDQVSSEITYSLLDAAVTSHSTARERWRELDDSGFFEDPGVAGSERMELLYLDLVREVAASSWYSPDVVRAATYRSLMVGLEGSSAAQVFAFRCAVMLRRVGPPTVWRPAVAQAYGQRIVQTAEENVAPSATFFLGFFGAAITAPEELLNFAELQPSPAAPASLTRTFPIHEEVEWLVSCAASSRETGLHALLFAGHCLGLSDNAVEVTLFRSVVTTILGWMTPSGASRAPSNFLPQDAAQLLIRLRPPAWDTMDLDGVDRRRGWLAQVASSVPDLPETVAGGFMFEMDAFFAQVRWNLGFAPSASEIVELSGAPHDVLYDEDIRQLVDAGLWGRTPVAGAWGAFATRGSWRRFTEENGSIQPLMNRAFVQFADALIGAVIAVLNQNPVQEAFVDALNTSAGYSGTWSQMDEIFFRAAVLLRRVSPLGHGNRDPQGIADEAGEREQLAAALIERIQVRMDNNAAPAAGAFRSFVLAAFSSHFAQIANAGCLNATNETNQRDTRLSHNDRAWIISQARLSYQRAAVAMQFAMRCHRMEDEMPFFEQVTETVLMWLVPDLNDDLRPADFSNEVAVWTLLNLRPAAWRAEAQASNNSFVNFVRPRAHSRLAEREENAFMRLLLDTPHPTTPAPGQTVTTSTSYFVEAPGRVLLEFEDIEEMVEAACRSRQAALECWAELEQEENFLSSALPQVAMREMAYTQFATLLIDAFVNSISNGFFLEQTPFDTLFTVSPSTTLSGTAQIDTLCFRAAMILSRAMPPRTENVGSLWTGSREAMAENDSVNALLALIGSEIVANELHSERDNLLGFVRAAFSFPLSPVMPNHLVRPVESYPDLSREKIAWLVMSAQTSLREAMGSMTFARLAHNLDEDQSLFIQVARVVMDWLIPGQDDNARPRDFFMDMALVALLRLQPLIWRTNDPLFGHGSPQEFLEGEARLRLPPAVHGEFSRRLATVFRAGNAGVDHRLQDSQRASEAVVQSRLGIVHGGPGRSLARETLRQDSVMTRLFREGVSEAAAADAAAASAAATEFTRRTLGRNAGGQPNMNMDVFMTPPVVAEAARRSGIRASVEQQFARAVLPPGVLDNPIPSVATIAAGGSLGPVGERSFLASVQPPPGVAARAQRDPESTGDMFGLGRDAMIRSRQVGRSAGESPAAGRQMSAEEVEARINAARIGVVPSLRGMQHDVVMFDDNQLMDALPVSFADDVSSEGVAAHLRRCSDEIAMEALRSLYEQNPNRGLQVANILSSGHPPVASKLTGEACEILLKASEKMFFINGFDREKSEAARNRLVARSCPLPPVSTPLTNPPNMTLDGWVPVLMSFPELESAVARVSDWVISEGQAKGQELIDLLYEYYTPLAAAVTRRINGKTVPSMTNPMGIWAAAAFKALAQHKVREALTLDSCPADVMVMPSAEGSDFISTDVMVMPSEAPQMASLQCHDTLVDMSNQSPAWKIYRALMAQVATRNRPVVAQFLNDSAVSKPNFHQDLWACFVQEHPSLPKESPFLACQTEVADSVLTFLFVGKSEKHS